MRKDWVQNWFRNHDEIFAYTWDPGMMMIKAKVMRFVFPAYVHFGDDFDFHISVQVQMNVEKDQLLVLNGSK